jgi:hypothetical protein
MATSDDADTNFEVPLIYDEDSFAVLLEKLAT